MHLGSIGALPWHSITILAEDSILIDTVLGPSMVMKYSIVRIVVDNSVVNVML